MMNKSMFRGRWGLSGIIESALLTLVLMVFSSAAIAVNFPFANETIVTSSDSASNARFGSESVRISGNTIVTTGYADLAEATPGLAYVFEYDEASNSWQEIQKFTGSDTEPGDGFGTYEVIALQNDTLIIGAVYHNGIQGAAYVFNRDPDTGVWSESQKLQASDGNSTFFGEPIALDGNTAVIGSYQKAYVFERDETGVWSEKQVLTSPDPTDGFANYGIALSGDYLVVGAVYDGDWHGAAYMFERDDTGSWMQVQKLYPSDPMPDTEFGHAAAINGRSMVIGANGSEFDPGAVYVFDRDDATGAWLETQKLLPSDGQPDNHFGEYVDMQDANTIVVGSHWEGIDITEAGAAYLYSLDSKTGVWSERQKLTASDRQTIDEYGAGVSISGNKVVVGSKAEKIYVYDSPVSRPHDEDDEDDEHDEDEQHEHEGHHHHLHGQDNHHEHQHHEHD